MAKRLNTRRKLSAGAAVVTGLGMVGIATATPAQAEVSGTLEYQCSVPDQGQEFEDPWTVALTIDIPDQVEPGESIPAGSITADVTPDAVATDLMRGLNVEYLEGSANTSYTFGEGEANDIELDVPRTDIPDEGSVTVTGTGTSVAETAPEEEGEVDIVAGDFTAALENQDGFVFNIECTAPEDNTVGSITVGEGSGEEDDDGSDDGDDNGADDGDDGDDNGSEDGDDNGSEDGDDNGSEDGDDNETDEPVEANDWFKEPNSLPITEDQKHFTVEGEAAQDGVIQVVLLDGDKKELRTDEWNVTEGSNSKNFPFEDGTDYVRVISQDCVDANGDDEEVVGSGCNVEYYAPWINPDDGDGDDSGSGDDSDAGEGDAGDDAGSGDAEQNGSAPEVPSVVQTDGFQRTAAPQQDNTLALALGGLLLAGAGAGTIVVARRRAVSQH